MPFHVYCYLRQNEQNEQNKKVTNRHLEVTKWLTKTTSHPRQILTLPPSPQEKLAVSFQSIFGMIVFSFLFHISVILIIPILPVLITEKTEKNAPIVITNKGRSPLTQS